MPSSFERRTSGGLVYFAAPSFGALPHGFFTRLGGVSTSYRASLNFSFSR